MQLTNYLKAALRNTHSTEQAIMEITDNLKASIDSNLISCGLFLDFSKAFDTVNHQILLDKGTVVRVPNQVMFKSSYHNPSK